MLQSIRDKSQGWLAGGIIGLVCITFAFWGIHSYLTESNAPTAVIAKVNGQTIQQAELNAAYQRLRQQQQAQLGASFVIDQKIENQLKKQALNQLIMSRVLSQAAAKDGYRITPDEVGTALLSIPMFQVDGRFSRERFNEVLNNILYNENTFLAELQTTMLINQVRAGIIDSAFTLPGDIAAAAKLVNQKRDIGYLIIPSNRFFNTIQITPSQAQEYYQQHKDEFTSPEQVSIEYLKLSLSQIASQLHFTEAQLLQFYQNNLNNYTLPERWHVAHILVKVSEHVSSSEVANAQTKINGIAARLKAGEAFATLAQQYSDDVVSAKNDGVLEWFNPGMVDPAFEKATASLKQIGDISSPVRTKYGFSIIKLIGMETPQVSPFAKVKDQVEKALAQQQAEQSFTDASDKLSNLTYANPNSLEIAAKALGLQVLATESFSKKGGRDQITANPKVIDAAFKSDVLQGNNSDVISLDPDTLVVVRVKQHLPAKLQSFNQVEGTVTQLLKIKAAAQQAKNMGQQLLQDLKQGKDAGQLANQTNLTWQTVNNIGRFDTRIPGLILNAAFRAPRPSPKLAGSEGFSLPNGDFVLMSVIAVHDGDLGKNPAVQQRIYREELENSFGQLDYSLYVRGMLNNAKVDIKNAKLGDNSKLADNSQNDSVS